MEEPFKQAMIDGYGANAGLAVERAKAPAG